MDTSTEVKRQPASDPAATDGLASPVADHRSAPRPANDERPVAAASDDGRRVSVDPLRSTDRYRLGVPGLPRL